VNELSKRNVPLLAPTQGGVAERLIKIAKPPLTRGRGGFPIESKNRGGGRKTTPAASASVAAQIFIDDAALPSLRWCKEGNLLDSNSFTPSMTARIWLIPQKPDQ